MRLEELQKRLKEMEAELKRKEEHITLLQATAKKDDDSNLDDESLHLRQPDLHFEIQRNSLLLYQAIEQIHEGVLIVDPQETIFYVNNAFEKNTGLSRRDLLGQNVSIIKGRREGHKLSSAIKQAISSQAVWQGNISRKGSTRESSVFEVTVSPIKSKKGDIINYISIERNVSRELDLKQELQQAHKMQALGTLAGGIAHDFNNVLMPIIINTELMLWDAEKNSEQHRYLKQCLDAANRGKDLIHQIVTFSRRESKSYKPVEIVPIIKEALKLLRSSLPSTIYMHREIAADTGLVRSDPTQIHQIMINLCSNAADSMAGAGGEMSIAVNPIAVPVDDTGKERYPNLKPGKYVEIKVADTGTGIEPELLDRIFDPFFTTKKTGEGTGMGLAVVDGIIKSHNGTILVESKLNVGTTFRIYLPMVATENKKKKGNPEVSSGEGERILVVDDEKSVLESLENILRKLDYEVVTTDSAKEALNMLESAPESFNCVLTDQTMPDLTGAELSEAMLKVRPDLPIILCTGYSNLIDKEKAGKMGIKEYLEKPVSPGKLAKTLRAVLD